MRTNALRAAWADGQSVLGLWLMTADPVTVEALSGLSPDYTCLDLQHGLVGYHNAVAALQAQTASEAVPLARAEWNRPDSIGQLLDAGFMGVIVPMVNSVAEAEAAVSACRYAPRGSRSYGPTRAARALGPNYYPEADTEVLCLPMVETVEAVEQVEAIAAVEGLDGLYIGPSDLGLSLGIGPGADHPEPEFDQAIQRVLAACEANGIMPGIHSTPALTPKRLEQGFRFVTVTSDIAAITSGVEAAFHQANQGRENGQTGGSGDGMY